MSFVGRSAARIAVAALAFVVTTVATPAAASDGLDDLVRRYGDLPEVQRLVELHAELDGLLERYGHLETMLGRARLAAAEASIAAERAAVEVEWARARLELRVRSAYQLGTGASMEAILGASSLPELATFAELAARTIEIDDTDLRETILAGAVASAARARAEAERAALLPRAERLRQMLDRMQAAIDEANALAEQARVAEDARLAFEAQQREIAAALARTGSWGLGVIDYEQDQQHLIDLLGPTGGRSCDTPEGLVATGRGFSGYATWYGWEFAGNPTATGAPFDPMLFTAANRWLPFGTFLRVTAHGGCAIVLVNDRGPYGNEERVLDLSMAAARYLGVGVTWVDAEILVPASTLGG